MSLPPPAENQAFCRVSALEGGFVQCSSAMFLDPDPGETAVNPVISFLIRHSGRPETFVFDLGIHKNWATYNESLSKRMVELGADMTVPQDVAESLAKGGLQPADITNVCLSHVHIDHIGNPGDPAPRAETLFLP